MFNIFDQPGGVKNAMIGYLILRPANRFANVQKSREHVLVVGLVDNLMKISLATYTHVAEPKMAKVSVYDIEPEDVGIESQTLKGLIIEIQPKPIALIREALATQ